MKLEEARKLAVEAPLVVCDNMVIRSQNPPRGIVVDAENDSFGKDTASVNLALLVHCYNHFDEVVKALDRLLLEESESARIHAHRILNRVKEVKV